MAVTISLIITFICNRQLLGDEEINLNASIQSHYNTDAQNFAQKSEEIPNMIWQIEIPKINLKAEISERNYKRNSR